MKRILFTCLFIASYPIVSSAAFHPVATLSYGFAKIDVYSSTSIKFGPYPNSYIGTNRYDREADTGILIGGETQFPNNWAWQVGLSYFVNDSFTENGNVYEFADPAFNDLTYQYKIQSRRVSIDTKLSYAYCQMWHPYVSASIGEAFNKAYDYTEYPVASYDVPMTQPFADHTTNSFTYSVGLGIDVDITNHLRIGAGYRFVDLGNASLGTSSLQTNANTINNAHLHANEFLAQLSYVG